jgi:UDP-N-acetylglucosamine 2-epimerase
MMNGTRKLKVMTILGTRPEIIRLSRVLVKMDQYFDHKIVFTQQSYDYEMSQIFFEELELRKPDYILNVKAETLAGQIGNILVQTEAAITKERPDAVLIMADTNTALAGIIVKRLHIPIFHFEAGYRAFDWDIPEETNRRMIDAISDYNLAYAEHARRNLIREGIHQDTIFVIGSPYPEIFAHYGSKIERSTVLQELGLEPKKFFVVSTHREENVDNPRNVRSLFAAFDRLYQIYRIPIIVTLHPRTRRRMAEFGLEPGPGVMLHKPFGYIDYNKLQLNASCVLSDSGSVQEESSTMGFPAVLLRKSTERPETFDTGLMSITGFDANVIVSAVQLTLDQYGKGEEIVRPRDYMDTNVSTKVVKIILGHAGLRKYLTQNVPLGNDTANIVDK